MIKEVVTLSVVMTLLIGAATQLESIAQDSAQKAIAFSDDMNNAMECATHGIHISECSPNLMQYDFTPQTENLTRVLEEINELQDVEIVADEELVNQSVQDNL